MKKIFEKSKSSKKLEQNDWLQQFYIKESFRTMHAFTHLHHFFARKKFSSFLNRKKSQSSFQTFSDQLSQKIKNAQYKNSDYAIELENKNNYMYKFTSNITDINRKFCQILLKKEQTISQNTLFRDNLFDKICRKIQNRNEIMIIRNIDLLIVFFVQTLTIYDVIHFNHFYKTINENWNSVFFFHCLKLVHNSIFLWNSNGPHSLKNNEINWNRSWMNLTSKLLFITWLQRECIFLFSFAKWSVTLLLLILLIDRMRTVWMSF